MNRLYTKFQTMFSCLTCHSILRPAREPKVVTTHRRDDSCCRSRQAFIHIQSYLSNHENHRASYPNARNKRPKPNATGVSIQTNATVLPVLVVRLHWSIPQCLDHLAVKIGHLRSPKLNLLAEIIR